MPHSRVITAPDYSRRKDVFSVEESRYEGKKAKSRSHSLFTREGESGRYFHQREDNEHNSLPTRRRTSIEQQASERANTGVKRSRFKPFFHFNYRSSFCIKLIIILLLMDSVPGIDPSQLSKMICDYLKHKWDCEEKLSNTSHLNDSYCPGEFDNYMCWPHGEPGSSVSAECPKFLAEDGSQTFHGYRFCQPDGNWFSINDTTTNETIPWRHIDECDITLKHANNTPPPNPDTSGDETTLLMNFRIMYTVGYGVSLVCLVVALLLLGFFKKLHCTRNYIHMNLMVSFIIRYTVILVKDSVLLSHYGLETLGDLSESLNYDKLQQYCDSYGEAGWVLTRCRLVVTLMHYAITANYFWLLAEGLYLQMLLVFVMSENKYFAAFMVFGWGAPWISVLIWVGLRLNYENNGCWDMNDQLHIWWTIRAPIIISIVINFLIFVNIVRLIVSKLQAHSMAHSDYKLRLAKSTLALIPLLGIHYIVFLALTEEMTDKATPVHLKLGFDMFLTSIQGTLVSILYCFLNGEVRAEVKKAWRDWKTWKGLPRGAPQFRKSSTLHSGNPTTSVTYFSRHSASGADYLLMNEVRSQNVSRADTEKKEENGNSTPVGRKELSNGNGVIKDAQNNKIDYEHTYKSVQGDKLDGDIEANGDIQTTEH